MFDRGSVIFILTIVVIFIFSAMFQKPSEPWALAAYATQTEWSWKVPEGVTKINVISKRDGEIVLDKEFNVEPGQTFKLEVVE